MHSMVCFMHSDQLIQSLHHELDSAGHKLPIVLTSALNEGIRQVIRQQTPVLALIEASSFADGLAFYIFLRSDPSTHDIPVIFLSKDQRIQQYASIFADDQALHTSSTKDHLFQAMWHLLPDTELIEAEVAGKTLPTLVSMSA